MVTRVRKNTLSGMIVSDAVRLRVISLNVDKGIHSAIQAMVKHRINAILTTDDKSKPAGVVSKTDIVGAYYAGLPIETPVGHIMNAPPLLTAPEDSLEEALDRMRTHRVYRLYMQDNRTGEVIGTLSYPDIVGLLYQYCHACEYSHYQRSLKKDAAEPITRYTVREVMTPGVKSIRTAASLNRAMEMISMNRFGAMLVMDSNSHPVGVISKSDLILAYHHHVAPETAAENVMSFPVRTCGEDRLLEDAVRQIILADVQRLFIHRDTPDQVVGVLSLSDATRIRSGSCHACGSSRIRVEA